MSAPMSLRRAVEIVEAGEPVAHHMRAPEWLAASNAHTRARSILAAAVEAHEARKRSVEAHYAAMQRLEELERGE